MKVRNRLAEFFVPSEQATPALRAALLLTALAYGFLHALGPGHRKTVVFTLFLSRRTRWWEPAAAGFLSAGAHGGMGIFLILLLRMINPLSLLQNTENASRYLEGGTYLALALVGLFFLAGALKQLIRGEHHHHRGGEGYEDTVKNNRSIYLTVLTASLFPCPGSILILLFSLSLGEIGWGILAVLFLSLGMGITITGAALLARTGREGLFRRLKAREKGMARLGAALESGAYLFLVMFSLWMAAPFALSLFPTG
jgi:ABC-type nickel/cobalt efflux system permease component RcnA